jgi:hypothetical protein
LEHVGLGDTKRSDAFGVGRESDKMLGNVFFLLGQLWW